MSIVTLIVAAAVTCFLLIMIKQGLVGEFAWLAYIIIIALWLIVLVVLLSPALPSLGRV